MSINASHKLVPRAVPIQRETRVADQIAEVLLRHRIDRVFGIPGGTISPVFDALYGAGIEMVTGTPYRDIRYGLQKESSGQGYALEAARACLTNYFRSGMGDKVYGVAERDNRASVRVLEKLGMQPEARVQLYAVETLLTFSINADSMLSS